MKKKSLLICCLLSSLFAFGEDKESSFRQSLSIWFDKPCSLNGQAIWYAGYPEMWKGENKPESAGDTATNPDAEWESASLPIGNGSLGANIFGSVEAERITFNEKTLWRGGPNTAKGAEYYWNVNKQSAHVLKEIRQAFTKGDTQKAAMLTRKNFNSEVSYESYGEKPFRFGNFTTMGEFYVETGLSTIGMSRYRRELSLDSALAVVQFKKDNVLYKRSAFISYPANVMVLRFSADAKGMQNLTFSYAPNPVSTGRILPEGTDGLIYSGALDNNGMKYVVRICAMTQGGTVSNANGKLRITGADEVVFLVTADTDYKINFNPDFADPKAYVGVDPEETTARWITEAVKTVIQTCWKRITTIILLSSIGYGCSWEVRIIRTFPQPSDWRNTAKGKQTAIWKSCTTSSAVTCLSPARVRVTYPPTCRASGTIMWMVLGEWITTTTSTCK